MFRLPASCIQKLKVLKCINVQIIRGVQTSQSHLVDESVENKSEHYDIIIAGGGLVGTTLACSLGQNKALREKKVLLLEGGPQFKGFDGGEYKNRVSAINSGSIDLFKSIGAWNTIAEARYKPVKQFQVWDASSHAMITFNHDNFAGDIACIIENDLMLHAVYEQIKDTPNVEVKYESRIEEVELPRQNQCKGQVLLKSGGQITCDLLVGADGINSIVRKRMGIEPFTLNYNQMGLVATLELCDTGDNSVAWQRFLPTGPIAMLPLNDTLSSLVWSGTPTRIKELQSMPAHDFVDAVNDAFYKEYPKDSLTTNLFNTLDTLLPFGSSKTRQYPPSVVGVKEKSRACFPLGFGHAPSYVAGGAVLIGDAAHRVHPLAGQGVNLGFGDVKCLTDVLAEAVYSGFELGDKNALLKYERERLMKNVPIMFGIHGLQRLYNTTFSPIVMLRSIGLQAIQNLPPIKKLFMERAMG